MGTDYIDLLLFIAVLIDLFLKHRRYQKVKKMIPHWQRYQYNTTTLKYILYGIILFISALFLGYRLYTISQNVTWVFPEIFILIPVIDYYVLWDLFFHGIYFNQKAIYYKSEYYEFRRAVHIYRDLIKDHYEYEMIYRTKEGGLRTIIIKVPNEKEAFPLLAAIPFEEE